MKFSSRRRSFAKRKTVGAPLQKIWFVAQQNLGNSSPMELLPRLEIVRGGGTTYTSCCFVAAERCILA